MQIYAMCMWEPLKKMAKWSSCIKVLEGPADKSYGIHVAKLAGLPTELLKMPARF